MRRILMLSLIAAAACGPTRTQVEVAWNFEAPDGTFLSCDQVGVSRIDFSIAGEALQPDHYTCAEAGGGANLGSYLDGSYQLTVSGFDSSGNLTHQVTQTLDVRGGGRRSFNVDVPQVASTTGDLTLQWTFAGKTCAQAGIAVVHISVENQVITDAGNNPDLPCNSAGVEGTTISPFTPGLYTVDLMGVDGTGATVYAASAPFTVTVVAGQNALYNVDLVAHVSTDAVANLIWTFDGKSCAAAGVDQVTIFVDPDSQGNGGTNAGTVPCNSLGTDGASVSPLSGGPHSFAIYGSRLVGGTPSLLYRTHQPLAWQFAVGLTTDVQVSAESPP